jgi:hypothetical protein
MHARPFPGKGFPERKRKCESISNYSRRARFAIISEKQWVKGSCIWEKYTTDSLHLFGEDHCGGEFRDVIHSLVGKESV